MASPASLVAYHTAVLTCSQSKWGQWATFLMNKQQITSDCYFSALFFEWDQMSKPYARKAWTVKSIHAYWALKLLIKVRTHIVCYLPVGTWILFPSSPQWLLKYVKIQIFSKASVSGNWTKSNQIFQKLPWRRTSYSFFPVTYALFPCENWRKSFTQWDNASK